MQVIRWPNCASYYLLMQMDSEIFAVKLFMKREQEGDKIPGNEEHFN